MVDSFKMDNFNQELNLDLSTLSRCITIMLLQVKQYVYSLNSRYI
jgi:hypothetical protein